LSQQVRPRSGYRSAGRASRICCRTEVDALTFKQLVLDYVFGLMSAAWTLGDAAAKRSGDSW
jgi:hypothetical protein